MACVCVCPLYTTLLPDDSHADWSLSHTSRMLCRIFLRRRIQRQWLVILMVNQAHKHCFYLQRNSTRQNWSPICVQCTHKNIHHKIYIMQKWHFGNVLICHKSWTMFLFLFLRSFVLINHKHLYVYYSNEARGDSAVPCLNIPLQHHPSALASLQAHPPACPQYEAQTQWDCALNQCRAD